MTPDRSNADYIRAEGLDRLIDFSRAAEFEVGAFTAVRNDLAIPVPPDASDLVRLHKIVRARRCFTALEFGVGYSTIVLADALEKNQQDWKKLRDRPEIRNKFQFQLFSVDASKKWIDASKKRTPKHLRSRVHLSHSPVKIGTFGGQLCHFFTNLPDIVPDFIYLDGPSPKDVQGKINGLSFQCDERTVMSGDLLFMEPIFLPGTFIIVDGRTNNARFLARNFKRKYDIIHDKEGDVTTFDLSEERLGPYNVLGTDFLKAEA